MSIEHPSENPYESLVRASDNRLVKESERDTYERDLEEKRNQTSNESDQLEGIEIEENDYALPSEKKGISRRNFLRGVGGAVIVGAVAGSGILEKIDTKGFSEKIKKFEDFITSTAEGFERSPELLTPMEQFLKFRRIENLPEGIVAIEEEHFRHLTGDKDGRNDMKEAVENLSGLNMTKFTQPFVDRGLPRQLAYMIAIQETRGKNVTSWAGAEGMMGIMPQTAEALGYPDADLHNPYVASKISAHYCAEEKTRFEEGDMILHAYNCGAGLFGFTGETPKKERTSENFYRYMEGQINKKYEKYENAGYFTVNAIPGKGLYSLSKKFEVSLTKIYKLNGLNEKSILQRNQEIRIPFVRTPLVLKHLFRKELETLRYTPEVKAKYEVLKHQELLAHLDSDFVSKSDQTT